MQPERPGDQQFDLTLFSNLLVDFETNGLPAQIAGPAGSDPGHASEPVRKTQF
jgi:hypothetical protein